MVSLDLLKEWGYLHCGVLPQPQPSGLNRPSLWRQREGGCCFAPSLSPFFWSLRAFFTNDIMARVSRLRKKKKALLKPKACRWQRKNVISDTLPPRTPPPPSPRLSIAQKGKKLLLYIEEKTKTMPVENLVMNKQDLVKPCDGVVCQWCFESILKCNFINHQVDIFMKVTWTKCQSYDKHCPWHWKTRVSK